MLRAAALAPPGRALDLACGAGRDTAALLARGWHVTAVDGSGAALALVDSRATRIRADLETGTFAIEPDAWDLVVNTLYLERRLFSGIRRGLRDGGIFAGVYLSRGRFGISWTELAEAFAGWQILDREGTGETIGMLAQKTTLAQERGPAAG